MSCNVEEYNAFLKEAVEEVSYNWRKAIVPPKIAFHWLESEKVKDLLVTLMDEYVIGTRPACYEEDDPIDKPEIWEMIQRLGNFYLLVAGKVQDSILVGEAHWSLEFTDDLTFEDCAQLTY